MSDSRAFIAIKPSDRLIAKLRAIETTLNTGSIKGAWVRPENVHLTLKFLGSINETQVETLEAAMKLAASSVRPFTLSAHGLGAFPTMKAPRIIWIGIVKNDTLNHLYGSIEEELSRIGFEKERRAFHPHLTLCRVRSTAGSIDLTKTAEGFHADAPIAFPVESIGLYKSVLTPKGALYTLVREAQLG